jgi:hypothetical protein
MDDPSVCIGLESEPLRGNLPSWASSPYGETPADDGEAYILETAFGDDVLGILFDNKQEDHATDCPGSSLALLSDMRATDDVIPGQVPSGVHPIAMEGSKVTINTEHHAPPHPPHSRPQPDHARAVLENAVRRAMAIVEDSPKHQWAREFLLDYSPHGAAQLLTSRDALRRAESSEYFGTFFDVGAENGGSFSSLNKSESMFVPAFAVGHLTVGVSVHRSANAGSGNALPTTGASLEHSENLESRLSVMASLRPPSYAVGRYVRDGRNGRMLFVIHDNTSAFAPPVTCTMLYIKPLSFKKYEAITFVCDGSQFTKGNIIDSVNICLETTESRLCPFCFAPPSVTCCINPQRIFDPFEIPLEFQKISREHCEYLGTARVIATIPPGMGGHPSCSIPEKSYWNASLVSKSCIKDYTARDIRHNELASLFQLFAVQLSISDRPPTRAVMPATDLVSEDGRERSTNTHHLANLGEECLHNPELNIAALVASLESGLEEYHDHHANQMQSNKPKLSFCDDGDSIVNSYAPAIVGSMADSLPNDAVAHPFLGPNEAAQESHPSTELALDGVSRCSVQTDRELRRKLKNRRTAAKSYARKKEQNDKLRKELQEASQKTTELRASEVRLRVENLALRRRLVEEFQKIP